MSLLVKGARQGRDIVRVTGASSGLQYVGFSAHRLQPGEELALPPGDREVCLVVLSGVVTVRVGSTEFKEIGRRDVLPALGAPTDVGIRARATAYGATFDLLRLEIIAALCPSSRASSSS